jgi:phosphatidylethanolamine/phosphatidyl-N-methylethanolamine N-methyltransferase
VTDTLLFLRSFLRNPSRAGAVAPSSRTLATVITADLPLSQPIIELGPGTGAFTLALLARGVPEHQLVLVESDPVFAQALKGRFPRARVLTMDAVHLGSVAGFFDEPAGAVVSGLPLLSMPIDQVAAILEGAFRHVSPEGALYQFTYLPRCPVPWRVLYRLGLEAHRVGYTWANLPPAFVYCLRRRLRSSNAVWPSANSRENGHHARPAIRSASDTRVNRARHVMKHRVDS